MGVIGLGAILGLAGWGNVLSDSKPLAGLILLAGLGVFRRRGGLGGFFSLPDTTDNRLLSHAF